MCLGGGGNNQSSDLAQKNYEFQLEQVRKAEEKERQRQADIQSGLRSIDDQFGTFNNDYYDKILQQQQAYVNPQLAAQQERDKQNIRFSLARNGIYGADKGGNGQPSALSLGDSSIGIEKGSFLRFFFASAGPFVSPFAGALSSRTEVGNMPSARSFLITSSLLAASMVPFWGLPLAFMAS